MAINKKSFKEFLSLFQYADEDKKKTESIQYIIEIMDKAETEHSVLTFDRLGEPEYMPNPLLDHSGNLYINTRVLLEMFLDYERRIRFIKTEAANICREVVLISKDIIDNPLSDDVEEESEDDE